jgi:hypothetical protein
MESVGGRSAHRLCSDLVQVEGGGSVGRLQSGVLGTSRTSQVAEARTAYHYRDCTALLLRLLLGALSRSVAGAAGAHNRCLVYFLVAAVHSCSE